MADSDAAGRGALTGLLSDAGHEVLAFASGEEVLEAAREGRPQLVALEIGLPGICGYEVCRRLRGQYGQSVPIVFVSAIRTESFDRVAGILLGADDYFCKPLAADEFLARIQRLVRQADGERRPTLTPREREVLSLLDEGLTHREIGTRLRITDKTVGTHVEHIFSKLGVHTRWQAVALARQRLTRLDGGAGGPERLAGAGTAERPA